MERKLDQITPVLIPVASAVKLSGIGATRLWALIGSGQVTARRFGRRTLVERQSLLAFIDALPVARGKAA